jgi:hypothetical protein
MTCGTALAAMSRSSLTPHAVPPAEAVVELDAIENGNGLRDMDVIEIHATRSQLRML